MTATVTTMSTQTATIRYGHLRRLVNVLRHYVAGPDRSLLAAAHIYCKDGQMWAEATDSYKLIRVRIDDLFEAKPDVCDILVPVEWLVKTLTAVRYRAQPLVLGWRTPGHITIHNDQDAWTTALEMPHRHRFPDFDKLIEEGSTVGINPAGFNRQHLHAALLGLHNKQTFELVQMDPLKPLKLRLIGGNSDSFQGWVLVMPRRIP